VKRISLIWVLGLLALVTAGFAEAYEKMVFGVVEKVTLLPENIVLSSKLDTGAKTSSLGAVDIKAVEENGEKWIEFTVKAKKDEFRLRKKLIGYARIKIRDVERIFGGFKKTYVSRPVVLMKVKLGDREALIKVNLTDRHHFNYPFLLGRDAIAALGGIVDPAKAFVVGKSKASSK